MRRGTLGISAALLVLAVVSAYANHFRNAFHFDDSHAVLENGAIRSLGNIPRFFTDARTFSAWPAHQTWRPLVSTTLAIDYRLGGGPDPFWFHVDTFAWFLATLAAIYAMNATTLRGREEVALLATAVFALHPVAAETVNYIVQRAEIHATLGAVLGIAAYARWPRARRTGAYLLPVLIGSLSKPIALTFPLLLLAYVVLFEEEPRAAGLRRAVLRSLPAAAVCGAMLIVHGLMTSKSYTHGGHDRLTYWMTQPSVVLHYAASFFLPTGLTADTDRARVTNLASGPFLAGVGFLAVLLWLIVWAARRTALRPVSFGIAWFLIGLAPTSIAVLAEVDNDHRMFFPFVGLSLAVCTAAAEALALVPARGRRAVVWSVPIVALLALAWGTHRRNEVWRTEETLWRDVVAKSPRNGRGRMNYGNALLDRGDFAGALECFRRAEPLVPTYPTLQVNIGIASSALKDDVRAEAGFRKGLELDPSDAQAYFYYGRFLYQRGRLDEARRTLTAALERNPAQLDAAYLLMTILADAGDTVPLRELAERTLRAVPGDPTASEVLRTMSGG